MLYILSLRELVKLNYFSGLGGLVLEDCRIPVIHESLSQNCLVVDEVIDRMEFLNHVERNRSVERVDGGPEWSDAKTFDSHIRSYLFIKL